MKSVWHMLRRFLTAEEVPRWFGLSVILIYLIGLGAVANVGIGQARREAALYFQQSSRYALTMLGERLSALGPLDPDDAVSAAGYHRALREFSNRIPTRAMRVTNGQVILASTLPGESGTPYVEEEKKSGSNGSHVVVGPSFDAGFTDAPLLSGFWSMRVPLRFATVADVSPAIEPSNQAPVVGPAGSGEQANEDETPAAAVAQVQPPLLILEATFPPEATRGIGLADQAGSLAIILVVLGALFLVYRCLREQLRGVSRIADRLKTCRDRVEEELATLRIADTIELDNVTRAWNQLVDLTQRLVDTVQRTEANEELSQALQRSGGGALAEALHAVPDGMVYVTDEVCVEYANAAAVRLFGWDEERVKGMTLSDAEGKGVGERLLALLRESLQPDGNFQARMEMIEDVSVDAPAPGAGRAPAGPPPSGSYRVWIIPLHRAHRSGECVMIIRDVSQQLRAEKAREEFVAQVTHELRTPLTNIRAYAETLSSGMFEDPQVITECYNVITKETRRLSRLIEDILSVSQLEVGSIDLAVDAVDLKTLLGEAIRDVRGLADEKNIDLQLVLPSKLDPIRADRDKLAVVINNLLGNAIKYTRRDGNVVVGCQLTTNEVVLTFKDNGIGIDPADQARVFEKFQRGSDPEVRNETGTGIGLYTAREIARRHGGDIELISEKGKGSTFMVRLPHRESRASTLTTATQKA